MKKKCKLCNKNLRPQIQRAMFEKLTLATPPSVARTTTRSSTPCTTTRFIVSRYTERKTQPGRTQSARARPPTPSTDTNNPPRQLVVFAMYSSRAGGSVQSTLRRLIAARRSSGVTLRAAPSTSRRSPRKARKGAFAGRALQSMIHLPDILPVYSEYSAHLEL